MMLEVHIEDGNAFAILAECQRVARKAGWSKDEITEFINEATAGGYQDLLRVVQENFIVT